jgi:DNA polymerase
MSEQRITQAGALTLVPDTPRFLLIYLPSGRALSYYRPRIEAGDRGDQLTYRGRTPGSRVGTHAGKLVENVVQAISRDVLAHGLKGAARDPGLRIVGHVHDEIICEADPADTGALDRLCAAMSPPPWCHDAPIRAVGWVGPWYRKD